MAAGVGLWTGTFFSFTTRWSTRAHRNGSATLMRGKSSTCRPRTFLL